MNIVGQQQNIFTDILKPVWNWLTPSEKSEFRKLSKFIKQDIDSKIGCEITLDDKNFAKKQTLAPPASIIHVISVSSIYNVKMMITFPLLICKIYLDGNINSENLQHLLNISCNLNKLWITSDFAVTSKLLENISKSHILLQNLHELNITNICRRKNTDPVYGQETTFWQNVEYLLLILEIPNLQNLHIENFFDCPNEFDNSMNTLRQCLVRWELLKHLYLSLHKGHGCDHKHTDDDDFSHLKLTPKINDNNNELQLNDLETFVIHCDKPYHQISDTLLGGCVALSKLSYDKPWATWLFYSPIIQINSETLRYIKILNVAPRIDMCSVGPCTNLRALYLSKATQSGNDKLIPDIINFQALPKSLLTIEIKNYSVDSLNLHSIVRLVNLQSVHFEFLSTRYNPETGIISSVVTTLLTRFRKLSKLFIEEETTHKTCLNHINHIIEDINMVPYPNRIRRLGIERWALAIASNETFENWRDKLHLYKLVQSSNDIEVEI